MTAYPNIRTYQQLLAESDLGSQNVDFYNPQGQLVSGSIALDTLKYEDDYTFTNFNTYGAVANYYERNRRLNGAYGNAYYGDCNYLNPVNHFNLIQENHFYYLEDYILDGPHANFFIHGLTFFTYDRPAVYYQYYNSSFTDNVGSYYRVDILGDEYPYNRDNKKVDIVIQQFNTGNRNRPVSDKLYLNFIDIKGHGYHSEYQMRIPVGLMLFNDKLYNPSVPVYTPPEDDGDNNSPILDPTPPPVPPPVIGEPLPTDPYSNFGGDTTDTGPTANIDVGINPYFSNEENARWIDYYSPSSSSWWNIFRWY